MALLFVYSGDRTKITSSFIAEPIILSASWSFLEEASRLREQSAEPMQNWIVALDSLLEYVGSGFVDIGSTGEYLCMLLLLMACRRRTTTLSLLADLTLDNTKSRMLRWEQKLIYEEKLNDFDLILMKDFLLSLFAFPVSLDPKLRKRCNLRISAFHDMDNLEEVLTGTLINFCFLRGQGIKLYSNYSAIDLLVPMYGKVSKKLGCIVIQCKNKNRGIYRRDEIFKSMEDTVKELLSPSGPIFSLLLNLTNFEAVTPTLDREDNHDFYGASHCITMDFPTPSFECLT